MCLLSKKHVTTKWEVSVLFVIISTNIEVKQSKSKEFAYRIQRKSEVFTTEYLQGTYI